MRYWAALLFVASWAEILDQDGAFSETLPRLSLLQAATHVKAASSARSATNATSSQAQARDEIRGYEGDFCFFVRGSTASASNGGRERMAAVVQTWAQEKRLPQGGHLFFFSDEESPPSHLPRDVDPEQVFQVPSCDHSSIGRMEKAVFNLLNTPQFLDKCDWFVMADDDSYVNMANVAAKARCVNPAETHLMGKLDASETIVHGSMRVFTKPAVALLAKAVNECPLGDFATLKPFFDDRLMQCMRGLKLEKLYPSRFGFSLLNHTRAPEAWGPKLFNTIGLELSEGLNAKCVDWLHKLEPAAMHLFDDLLLQLPTCRFSGDEIREDVGDDVALHEDCLLED